MGHLFHDPKEIGEPEGETTPDQLTTQKENDDTSSPQSAPVRSEQAPEAGDTVDISDVPTVVNMPLANDVEEISPPPPQTELSATSEKSITSDQGVDAEIDETDEGKKAGETEAAQVASEEEKSEAMQESSDQHETVASTNGFPILSIGEQILDRYEITQILNESPQEHIYQVIDHQGYQHCWNCGSEQNAEGDEFCINCGASMIDVPYTMHEYSTEQSSERNKWAY